MNTDRLYKDMDSGPWCGVFGGLGECLDVDPAILRFVYCVFTIFTGFFLGILLYIVASCCLPDKEDLPEEKARKKTLREWSKK